MQAAAAAAAEAAAAELAGAHDAAVAAAEKGAADLAELQKLLEGISAQKLELEAKVERSAKVLNAADELKDARCHSQPISTESQLAQIPRLPTIG